MYPGLLGDGGELARDSKRPVKLLIAQLGDRLGSEGPHGRVHVDRLWWFPKPALEQHRYRGQHGARVGVFAGRKRMESVDVQMAIWAAQFTNVLSDEFTDPRPTGGFPLTPFRNGRPLLLVLMIMHPRSDRCPSG